MMPMVDTRLWTLVDNTCGQHLWTTLVDNTCGHLWTTLVDNTCGHLWTTLVDTHLWTRSYKLFINGIILS
jgi:hypothetical protein